MAADLHLCPCCAAHLRVDSRLHTMRCNNCEAELVFINEGGVRGLAFVPPYNGVIPYSHPAQRHGHFDGRAFLDFRRELVMLDARRRQRTWSRLFFGSAVLLATVFVAGMASVDQLVHGPKENVEAAASVFLTAVATLPIFAYVSLYFQGRARLVRENAERWRTDNAI